MEEERLDPLPPAPARPVPHPGPSPAFPLPAFLQSSFSLRPAPLGWQTKSLNKATGGRRLIKMHLFALRPGCHLLAALSSQNSCAARIQTLPGGGVMPRGGQKLHRPPRPPIHLVLETQLQAVLTCTRAAGSAGAHLLSTSWGAGAQGPRRPAPLLLTAGQPRAVGLTGS